MQWRQTGCVSRLGNQINTTEAVKLVRCKYPVNFTSRQHLR